MKMEHYSDYLARDTERSESALLTVWAVLQDLTDDLVLVGGLVPKYICKHKVCEVGPFLCLKLLAYQNRAQSKDVFDVVRAVRDYDGGTEAAAMAFRAESGINLAFNCALHTLKTRFSDISEKGPVQYADFCMGGLGVVHK